MKKRKIDQAVWTVNDKTGEVTLMDFSTMQSNPDLSIATQQQVDALGTPPPPTATVITDQVELLNKIFKQSPDQTRNS